MITPGSIGPEVTEVAAHSGIRTVTLRDCGPPLRRHPIRSRNASEVRMKDPATLATLDWQPTVNVQRYRRQCGGFVE
ncbi:hypothetical protein [Micromonospora sp. NPDC051006]|uniref:hypothetical protein n=1 Tax=Micromonospora sp. NPDC051006 TaxID=3364283 RepID=UPI00379C1D75